MRKFYYIEVLEQGECVRRIPSTKANLNPDFIRMETEHPDMEIRMIVSSEKEKAINKLQRI